MKARASEEKKKREEAFILLQQQNMAHVAHWTWQPTQRLDFHLTLTASRG
jgi:hypothetical protein